MPRTILTDDVIERLCPEYQPLELPNAYFKNVGGMVRSQGIKATPSRPPARPARVNYLSNNSGISLTTIRANVLGTQEIAQPVVDDLRVVVRPTAPPIEPNMLAGMPPSFDIGIPPPTFEEALAIGIPPPTFEEAMAIGIPPPAYSEILEEKGDIPYVDVVAVQTQGDQGDIGAEIISGEEEIRRGEEDIKRTEEGIKRTEEQLGLVKEMREFGERSTTQIAEQIKKLREAQAGLQQEPRSLFFAREDPFQELVKRRVRIEGRKREQAVEKVKKTAEEFAKSALIRGQIVAVPAYIRREEAREGAIRREQAVEKVKKTAEEFAESGLLRGQSRAIIAQMRRERAREALPKKSLRGSMTRDF